MVDVEVVTPKGDVDDFASDPWYQVEIFRIEWNEEMAKLTLEKCACEREMVKSEAKKGRVSVDCSGLRSHINMRRRRRNMSPHTAPYTDPYTNLCGNCGGTCSVESMDMRAAKLEDLERDILECLDKIDKK